MTEHEKNFIQLGRGYLSLLYLKALYKSAGDKLPDDLVNGIETMEHQVRDISDMVHRKGFDRRSVITRRRGSERRNSLNHRGPYPLECRGV